MSKQLSKKQQEDAKRKAIILKAKQQGKAAPGNSPNPSQRVYSHKK